MPKVRSLRHASSSTHKRLRWFVSRVLGTRFLVLARLQFKRYIGSLELCRQSSDLCKIDCYPHLFRCSTINSTFFYNLRCRPSVALLSHHFLFVQFSRYKRSGLTPDLKTQIPLCFEIQSQLVGPSGLEPPTLRLSVVRSSQLSYGPVGGDSRDRTGDLLLARQALSQLSYIPMLSRFPFPGTVPSKLNNERWLHALHVAKYQLTRMLPPDSRPDGGLLRKEVIQPLVLERLPCYDFTPIIEPTFGRAPLAVRLRTSGVPDSHGVTGGVYKARERIHRGMLIRDY